MFDFLTSGSESAANVLPYFYQTADSKIFLNKQPKECPLDKKYTVPNLIIYIYRHSESSLKIKSKAVNETLFSLWQPLKFVYLGKRCTQKRSFFTNTTLVSSFSVSKENDTYPRLFIKKLINTYKRNEVKNAAAYDFIHHQLKATSMIPIISRAEGDPIFSIPMKIKTLPDYIFQEPTSTITNTYSVGRLATYNFCNMDRKVAQALTTIKKIMHEQPEDDVIRQERNILFS